MSEIGGMKAIGADQTFRFACHPAVPCFTECCRMLELALHPYDFILLRRATGLDSPRLFEQFIIEEEQPGLPFPRHYLAMVDDGRASCPFVGANGCGIYPFRPAACRSYPLGRAALFAAGVTEERFVCVREPHCRGFASGAMYRPTEYLAAQGLDEINRCHDAVARFLQRPEMRDFTPKAEEKRLYVLALCQIDLFRARLEAGAFPDFAAADAAASGDDGEFLIRTVAWLERKFFHCRQGASC
ncbi:MAG: YkgJ family cysteine cluster protein [Desulfobulbaceae bacterium]|jgi:Fe-S-cluster containining protein|nr:YkgJ family cysteine cluster protein [Desulfobulbaceae bacterium]